ncbi:bouquet formation protein Bqt2 [Schizosaccharomyces japonicus yFS275]|uniref:Bouquet formation protein Bqt2 n=1 Tax=Schizosaccharomyces japonicus (strain yFS275 / FY16936) TaxID=402676 RepID=B6K3U6_SCHJY|nr:bouquet formation protein Bqt2 [Schizosaccharomyces japonicus yFS275]EEB08153.1 bouquet formation protein Bqt2 [Schizosaccharomyces japonicus yFS275]
MFRGKTAYFDESVPPHIIALWQLYEGEVTFYPVITSKVDYYFSSKKQTYRPPSSIHRVNCTSPWWIVEFVADQGKLKENESVLHMEVTEPFFTDVSRKTVYLKPPFSMFSFD